MELRHLRYFVAVAEEQSFTRAAERLWIAQPGLSTQIRRLEEELGVKLLTRHPRGVEMTDAGRIFLERARAALIAAEEARATGDDIEAGLVGGIRLGIATGARWSLVSQLLDSFAADHPEVELTVVESNGGTLLRDLRDGRLDALVAPSSFSSPELQRAQIGSEPWAVLVGQEHRLGRPGPVAAIELRGEPIVVTGHRDGAGYDRAVAEMLSELGVTAELRCGGPGPALFKSVVDGEALALSTAAGAGSGDVIVRPLEPSRNLCFELLWRDETPAPALNELIRAAKSLTEPPARPAVRLMAVPA
ncbi:MAG TPA: LysR family transcriptional regulator [Thermoleophilaceae bacterium]|jgi:DNA-binding transcriptional LysR family regulator|nr:LysR family transcriptional regulator [Thermoleophilaceae bacterium]